MSDLTSVEDRLRVANPIPDPANPPMTASTAAAVLLDFKERNASMQTEETPKTTPPRRSRSPLLVTAAAFLVVLVVGIAVVLTSIRGDDVEPATVTTQPPITTTTQPATDPLTAEEALATADGFLTAFNAGDADAALALIADDATFGDTFGDSIGDETPRDQWEQRLVWNTAQGTQYSPTDCAAGDRGEDLFVVVCQSGTYNAETQAVDGPPVPTTLRIMVSSQGIKEFLEFFGRPDFFEVSAPFEEWMERNDPDDIEKIGFGNWETIEEARQNGLLTAQFADEWGAFLVANDCTYLDGC